mmetsp:Transcript_20212/g.51419  ORF Transcript_20212/g.51419 Transcript_20212/m.51419 type:complete len:241 (+) Transcript_20212:620-1342(+)
MKRLKRVRLITCTKSVPMLTDPSPDAESPAPPACLCTPPTPASDPSLTLPPGARTVEGSFHILSSNGCPKCAAYSPAWSPATHFGEQVWLMPCSCVSAPARQPSFTCTKYWTRRSAAGKPCVPTSSEKRCATKPPAGGEGVKSTPPRFLRAINSCIRAARSARRSASSTLRSARFSIRNLQTRVERACLSRYHCAAESFESSPGRGCPLAKTFPALSSSISSTSTPSSENPGVMSSLPFA